MRIFVFATFLFRSPVVGLAQPVPDLGPETDTPSIDDFDALPDAEPDESGQVVVEEPDPGETLSKLDSLYEDLAGAEDPAARQRVARDIRRIWMDSGSDTVDLLMARAGRAIQAEDHGLALDLLDVVVRSEGHTSELQSLTNLVCRLLLEKKKLPPPRLFVPTDLSTYKYNFFH